MPAADEPQPPHLPWKRSALVQRLAKCLTVALIASVPLFFAAFGLGPYGPTAFAVYFVLLSALALVTFFAALFKRDTSVALAAAFALAVIAAYWLVTVAAES